MGYSFTLLCKNEISKADYETALQKLSPFNRGIDSHGLVCDVRFDEKTKRYITVSGSFSISGKYAEGFVLNLLMNLLELGYLPKVLSTDWNYGTKDDWKELESL